MNYNFETNIERRTNTGMVYFVDRMTSDYAVANPFDLDGFIEEVYNEFAGTEYEENRDEMRRIWIAVLSVSSQCGDASLYPNNNGHHPALMKIWHKAGDFWRRGFRIGDMLPAIVPGCKITRFYNNEWIALSQKDMHLLEMKNEKCPVPDNDNTDSIESAGNQCSPAPSENVQPVELDMFAMMQAEMQNLRPQNEELRNLTQRRIQRKKRQSSACSAVHATAVTAEMTSEPDGVPEWCKYLGIAVATFVALILIYKTGFLIPLGLIGLGLSGLAK